MSDKLFSFSRNEFKISVVSGRLIYDVD